MFNKCFTVNSKLIFIFYKNYELFILNILLDFILKDLMLHFSISIFIINPI